MSKPDRITTLTRARRLIDNQIGKPGLVIAPGVARAGEVLGEMLSASRFEMHGHIVTLNTGRGGKFLPAPSALLPLLP